MKTHHILNQIVAAIFAQPPQDLSAPSLASIKSHAEAAARVGFGYAVTVTVTAAGDAGSLALRLVNEDRYLDETRVVQVLVEPND